MSANLLDRARRETTPLIDGCTVTFVWAGDSVPKICGEFNGWGNTGPTDLQPAGDGIWSLTVEVPNDAYIEYSFMNGETHLVDPYNPRRITNGLGSYNNFFAMPGAGPAPDNRAKRGIPHGKVTAEVLNGDWSVVGGKRRVHFYQPPVSEPCPLVLVWDGQDYLRRARIARLVDNLIQAELIRPIALAMPEHGWQARTIEYGCSDVTLAFVEYVVLPRARQLLNLVDPSDDPGGYGVLGASMGGLMALYTGLRMPTLFGRVFSQSGAFSAPGHDYVVWDLVRAANPDSLAIYLDVGTMEYLIDANRYMRDLLAERGFNFIYREYHGGHNYTCWSRDLAAGLEFLFPPVRSTVGTKA